MSVRPDSSDDDLMDLLSRYGYPADLEAGDRLLVNGKCFVLEDIVSDPATGLDAFTFRNTNTDELTVSFQGSVDGKDFLADATLVTSLTPAQYGAAEKYLKHVEQKNGRAVGSVCGNSLGGGLAAYIAVRYPRIRAVTLNPAPVPERYVGVAAPNVRNYISATDPLYRALVAGSPTR